MEQTKEMRLSSDGVKDKFISALSAAAGSDDEAHRLITFVTEHGREVPIIRSLGSVYPMVNREEFERLQKEAIPKFTMLAMEPPSWEEFQKMIAEHGKTRSKIPSFRLKRPSNFPSEGLALCQIPVNDQNHFLPGENAVAFSNQVAISNDGVTPILPYISITSLPISQFWLGMQGFDAVSKAYQNALDPQDYQPTDAAMLVDSVLGNSKSTTEATVARRMAKASVLIARLLNVKLKGEVFALVQTFGVSNISDINKRFEIIKMMQGLIKPNFDKFFGRPLSKLEDIIRDVYLIHALFGACMSEQEMIVIYNKMKPAKSDPYFFDPIKG